MHLKRWISSIIALPIVLYLIFSGGMPFLFLMIAVCAICLWEYFSIVFNNKHKNNLIIWLGFLLGIIIIIAAYEKSYDLILLIAAFDLICCALISIAASKTESSLLEAVSKQVQGIIYIPIFLAFLVLIRNDINGNIWIFYILFIIFAGDIGAYYIGTHFGRHKLIPIVSPGKTLEVAIA